MTNRVAKGAKAELLASKLLEEGGYMVEKVKRTKWHKQDFFGCWDICAVHPRMGLLWVQVSTSPIYKRGVAYKKKLQAFPTKPGQRREYWQWTDKKHFRIWRITNEDIKELE